MDEHAEAEVGRAGRDGWEGGWEWWTGGWSEEAIMVADEERMSDDGWKKMDCENRTHK